MATISALQVRHHHVEHGIGRCGSGRLNALSRKQIDVAHHS
jgi:hypothetical protein